MSDDSSGSEDSVPQTPTTWKKLTTVQKNEIRKQIASWLANNYIHRPGVSLLVELVYQHYIHYLATLSQMSAVNQKVFTKLLIENFPKVTSTQLGKRGKSACFFMGLEIQESSDEYDTVIKGRRTTIHKDAGKKSRKRKSSEKGDVKDQESSDTSNTAKIASDNNSNKDGIGSGQAATSAAEGTWKQLSSEDKETQWEQSQEWLESEYEMAPHACLLRTAVYNHFLDHCMQCGKVPPTQAIFGRMVQKKFKRVTMRRLGVRGESKYYYMGIDIRSTSDHYESVSQERSVCLGSKPKNSRFQPR